MQSYEHHIVYESLEMRHPYLQEPFSREIDPQQVSIRKILNVHIVSLEHKDKNRKYNL